MASSLTDEKGTVHTERADIDGAAQGTALGSDAGDLSGYWTSWRVVGSVLAIALMGNSLFVGYAMPVGQTHPKYFEQWLTLL